MTVIFGCPPDIAAGEHLALVEENAAAWRKQSETFNCPCCVTGKWRGTPETFQCDTCDVGRRA